MTEKVKNLIMILPNDHVLWFYFSLQDDSIFVEILWGKLLAMFYQFCVINFLSGTTSSKTDTIEIKCFECIFFF